MKAITLWQPFAVPWCSTALDIASRDLKLNYEPNQTPCNH